MLKGYIRNCKVCGEKIILGERDYDVWRTFDIPDEGSCKWNWHSHR
jgi:hypothetical protein